VAGPVEQGEVAHTPEQLVERLAAGRLDQQLVAKLALQTRHGSLRRAHHLDLFGRRGEQTPQLRAQAQRLLLLFAAHQQVGHGGERRVVHHAPEVELLLVEGLVILCGGHANGVVIRIDGLHQHDAREIAAARASGHLCEKLKRALGGAKVREAQAHIG
jgi:hypothetical protein